MTLILFSRKLLGITEESNLSLCSLIHNWYSKIFVERQEYVSIAVVSKLHSALNKIFEELREYMSLSLKILFLEMLD